MAKKQSTTTLDSLEALEIENISETVEPQEEPQPEAEAPEPPKPEQSDAEEPTSFVDAMQSSISESPKKEPEAKEEPEVEAETETASEPESRAAKDFKKIKDDRDTARRELDEIKSKLALQDSDGGEGKKALQDQIDLLDQQLKLSNIERHPSFQREFQNKINNVVEQAKGLVPADQSERVAELIQMNESDYRAHGLEEIMVDLSTTKQAKMGALLARIDEVRGEREAALSDADSTYQQLVQKETESREAEMAQTNKVFDEVTTQAQKGLELYQTREGDNGWNSEVKERIDAARNIFSGDNNAQSLAEASLWAATGPKYRELLAEAIEVNRRLREQIKTQGSATPSVTSGGSNTAVKEKSFIESVTEMTGGLG